ncbi:hypothetical protein LTR02_007417 [Friedmanniomyces endolithicus]|nr:hypothetical protein LTR59_016599 [Friedmanniomyces endolithicus]KAK0775713.1 hypothetical protein LTR38_015771 [Friedmanniomyces endolithicus]KAK0778347.1 hypothetical protein LTR75_015673 [Friedmanniomyces endolithicus]KAK0850854.1 hypothetical protein LTR03_004364 [Friedmanniomyces endolithicus]KAK0903733.1 hypothetical protein LTR02_007417 [Friedmanniomyces endolithicus]
MPADDLKLHALNPSTDFYALLSLQPTASELEIRRAYRKTALKYHPDKIGANNVAAREKFELLQVVNDVLSDAALRELYDNARRAEEAKREREAAFDGRRKWMREDLERREGAAGGKRKREEEEGQDFEREIRRLAEDGRRRRMEREEMMRCEAEKEAEDERDEFVAPVETTGGDVGASAGPPDLDRSITLLQDCVLREKKLKKDGEKHRSPYVTAVLVYKSIVGAHAAVCDISQLQQTDAEIWRVFEAVGWAAGKEPECLPKPQIPVPQVRDVGMGWSGGGTTPSTAQRDSSTANGGAGMKKAPSFASFKTTPAVRSSNGARTPSSDDIMMIRLKNAERRRLEEKTKTEEHAAATAAADA